MKPIKFRAWDKRFNNMIYDNPMAIFHLNDKDHEIMQYTGLKDKNGVEVYEGDVVRGKSYGKEFTVEAEWAGGGFIPFAEFDVKYCISFDNPDECEVLGNIHQHPELLK